MSIIEKAVSKLAKPIASATGNDRKEPGFEEIHSLDAVQRAANIQAVSTTDQSESAEVTSSLSVKLPFDDLYAKGMLTPMIPRSSVAEEFRAIKRPLLRNIAGDSAVPIDKANLIMVTSALQNEGKTFSAINLALSISMEVDKTVLLVDADTSKAAAGTLLGIPPSTPGLIDVLENKGVSLGDVILRTNLKNFSIIPAGNVHGQSTELLSSEGMHKLMEELAQRYPDRVIVFDSPPLLLTNEASVLANLVGQIVFVVRADETQQHAVTEALEHIPEDKMVGMVLNRARRNRAKPFGYGYGYGYGNHYGDRPGYNDSARAEHTAA